MTEKGLTAYKRDRGDWLYLAPMSLADDGMLVTHGVPEKLAFTADTVEYGQAVERTLALCHPGLSFPRDPSEVKIFRKPFFDALGITADKDLKAFKSCTVFIDDGKIMFQSSERRKSGAYLHIGDPIVLPTSSDYKAIGEALKAALEKSI